MKTYEIPFIYQKVDVITVEAENLQEAIGKAFKEFITKPEEGYLQDSWEIDGIIEDNYPGEEYDIDKAIEKL